MNVKWSIPHEIGSVDDQWKTWTDKSGVYIIRANRWIQRVGGVDKTGILYIGKAINLRRRIWRFLQCEHNASGFLWTHLEMARLVLNEDVRTTTDVIKHLRKLTVRYANKIPKRQLGLAERALLFSYLGCFGEAPPLNLNLPNRWELKPSSTDLNWAEKGIQSRK
jgi:hypothetical protein